MCSKCHKRVAVVFVTKLENGNKVSEGLCITCAKEMGVPVDNMLGNVMNQLGISPDQLENMEDEIAAMIPSDEWWMPLLPPTFSLPEPYPRQ